MVALRTATWWAVSACAAFQSILYKEHDIELSLPGYGIIWAENTPRSDSQQHERAVLCCNWRGCSSAGCCIDAASHNEGAAGFFAKIDLILVFLLLCSTSGLFTVSPTKTKPKPQKMGFCHIFFLILPASHMLAGPSHHTSANNAEWWGLQFDSYIKGELLNPALTFAYFWSYYQKFWKWYSE